MNVSPLLQVRGLKKYFPIKAGFFNKIVGQVKAVDGVTFDLYPGECLGLVGESGSGKTTVGRTLLRALSPTDGEIIFSVNGQSYNLATVSEGVLRPLRQHMQMIFQDPYSSLNPRMTVADIIGEPLLVNGVINRSEREARVSELLEQVGLKTEHLRRYPHAFSGGQRQRIGIARALALRPTLIVADEPVSALDVSVQAQVLNLLQDLQESFHLTYLFIAHDLSVVGHISDRIAVMYAGRLVELGATEELLDQPKHPYTEALLAAVPIPDPSLNRDRRLLSGEVADPANLPTGCVFHPRCPHAEDRCKTEVPDLREVTPGHFARCYFA
ncbi:peptide ABC transporter ATP-binding protein [Candidatus Poribacteria bacterium]|jgi:peptide/nickel transport system ATP-binding protein|nr:peptide ABC transporter ATP-binding protein [Candidatus Poribacteria bacterium]MDP6597673.1 ATP-binding cassette domain-containing protein [Candidatus Poribacteria bacterium]MDP6750633.1 ATP-binding cassette domain-containing protein [Candidatus Poribacteria bacterium]MDP6996769.1 ATP-binding cassette domain-containing protein [Candidatus Poribacteria bacterium]